MAVYAATSDVHQGINASARRDDLLERDRDGTFLSQIGLEKRALDTAFAKLIGDVLPSFIIQIN